MRTSWRCSGGWLPLPANRWRFHSFGLSIDGCCALQAAQWFDWRLIFGGRMLQQFRRGKELPVALTPELQAHGTASTDLRVLPDVP